MKIEFKGVGTLSGNKDVMALLEGLLWRAGDSYCTDGLKFLGEEYKEYARNIHRQLADKNYYGA